MNAIFKKVQPSATSELIGKVAEMKRLGRPVIEVNVGEPDFPTPDTICRAAEAAIREGFTRYTAVPGIFELREAICKKLHSDNNLDYTPDEIAVTVGGKQAIFNAMFALLNPGDEVIVLTPCWVSYIDIVSLCGGEAVLVQTREEEGFGLSVDRVRQAVTPKTRAIILNSPNNPTGAVYSEESLRALAELCVEQGIYVIADEIYEKLVYEGSKHVSIAAFGPEIKALTVTVNGFSKAYAMTGWRVGYMAGPKAVVSKAVTLQSHCTSSINSIAQKAALAALVGPQDSVHAMAKEYDLRRRTLCDLLNAIDGVSCVPTTGAFYLVPNVASFYGKRCGDRIVKNSGDVAAFLLDEAGIACMPGSAFEMPDNIRISYATSMETLERCAEGMKSALAKLV